MKTRSYLDALTPGMRAKLDPLYRAAREERTTGRIVIIENSPGVKPLRNVLWSVDRYKRREESRTKVASY